MILVSKRPTRTALILTGSRLAWFTRSHRRDDAEKYRVVFPPFLEFPERCLLPMKGLIFFILKSDGRIRVDFSIRPPTAKQSLVSTHHNL